MFLNDAILSTTIDYDSVINQGERAEARFSMFSSLTPKLASVPAQALPLSILAAIGFKEPVRGALQEQPGFVKNYISAMFFIFPTIITIISWLAKLTFPIRYQEQLDRVSLI
jgi:Na+/melibiose symporter-like transporter